MLPDGGERFPDPRSEPDGDLAQRLEHVFLACRLHLLLVEDVAGAAVRGAQPEDILRAQAGNRPFEHGSARRALADISGQRRRERRIRRLPHQRQDVLNALLRHQAEKRRLLQLDGQPLAERRVEHRIAGCVREIGEHNRVPVRELRLSAREAVRGDGSCGNDDGCDRSQDAPAHCGAPIGNGLVAARGGVGRLRVALQALEIRTHVGRVLIAQAPILFDRLEDHIVQPRRDGRLHAGRRRRLLVQNRGRDDGAGRAGECRPPDRHLVQHQAEREQIGSRVELFAAQLLGRHVGHGADGAAGAGQQRIGLPRLTRYSRRRSAADLLLRRGRNRGSSVRAPSAGCSRA